MKKILLSVLGIVLAVGVVSGAAYALFSTTATVSGITISSGNAGLAIYDGGTWTPINEFVVSLNNKLVNLYPGFTDYTNVDFYNNSNSNIGLDLKMQLTHADGDWSDLSNKIYIAVTLQGGDPAGSWYTLAQWNANPISFGTTLNAGAKVTYKVSFLVDGNAGN